MPREVSAPAVPLFVDIVVLIDMKDRGKQPPKIALDREALPTDNQLVSMLDSEIRPSYLMT